MRSAVFGVAMKRRTRTSRVSAPPESVIASRISDWKSESARRDRCAVPRARSTRSGRASSASRAITASRRRDLPMPCGPLISATVTRSSVIVSSTARRAMASSSSRPKRGPSSRNASSRESTWVSGASWKSEPSSACKGTDSGSPRAASADTPTPSRTTEQALSASSRAEPLMPVLPPDARPDPIAMRSACPRQRSATEAARSSSSPAVVSAPKRPTRRSPISRSTRPPSSRIAADRRDSSRTPRARSTATTRCSPAGMVGGRLVSAASPRAAASASANSSASAKRSRGLLASARRIAVSSPAGVSTRS